MFNSPIHMGADAQRNIKWVENTLNKQNSVVDAYITDGVYVELLSTRRETYISLTAIWSNGYS